jgi:hypothetical protein
MGGISVAVDCHQLGGRRSPPAIVERASKTLGEIESAIILTDPYVSLSSLFSLAFGGSLPRGNDREHDRQPNDRQHDGPN